LAQIEIYLSKVDQHFKMIGIQQSDFLLVLLSEDNELKRLLLILNEAM
jgi:hypothetical protein